MDKYDGKGDLPIQNGVAPHLGDGWPNCLAIGNRDVAQLAEGLGNASKACKLMGCHRDTFYEVKRTFQVGGVATLVEQKRGPRNPHPNSVAADVEKRILDYSLTYPT